MDEATIESRLEALEAKLSKTDSFLAEKVVSFSQDITKLQEAVYALGQEVERLAKKIGG
jgi:uncharacterized coiled-coil protein SlyX